MEKEKFDLKRFLERQEEIAQSFGGSSHGVVNIDKLYNKT